MRKAGDGNVLCRVSVWVKATVYLPFWQVLADKKTLVRRKKHHVGFGFYSA